MKHRSERLRMTLLATAALSTAISLAAAGAAAASGTAVMPGRAWRATSTTSSSAPTA